MRIHGFIRTICIAVCLMLSASTAISASPVLRSIAISNVADPAARQIVRNVVNNSLKTISTKEVTTEENEPALSAKVETEEAPGSRLPAAAVEKTEANHEIKPGVAAETALKWLKNGNTRYLKKANRSDGKSQADRNRLTQSQHPHTIILSCSDSRVPPETVFDQALGEIFVVRTAGESLDAAVIASLEYAVEHLGPRLLIVMGHTSCGAVNAAITAVSGTSAGSPSLDLLIADIKPRLPAHDEKSVPSNSLVVESSDNAKGVASDLLKRSEIIRSRVEKGELLIKPALYHLDSGTVNFF